MKRFKSILVAIDAEGLPSDDGELPQELVSLLLGASRICGESDGRITVITVVSDDDRVAVAARRRIERHVLPRLEFPDVRLLVTHGEPFLEIVREVLRGGHDLLAVAARPMDAGHGIVGATATRLIRKCPCPVWVASREVKPKGPRTVLSAVALHGHTPDVLEISASIVALRGGEWHVLHVPEYPLEGGMRLRGADAQEVQAYEKECRDAAFAAMHRLVDPLAEQTGVKPKLWMSEGHPHEQIADAEKRLGVDLIVMGTIGRGGLAGMLIGNTAERTLPLVTSSVLAIKPADFVCPVKLDG